MKKNHFGTMLALATAVIMGGTQVGISPAEEPAGEPEAAQGIMGKVLKLSGDFMPGPGPIRGKKKPLSVPVHIFRGKVKVFQEPDLNHPSFVKKVQADSEGNFRCALAPGEYTAVAEIDGKMYLNAYTMDNDGTCWITVKVEEGKWATFNIEDSSGAVF